MSSAWWSAAVLMAIVFLGTCALLSREPRRSGWQPKWKAPPPPPRRDGVTFRPYDGGILATVERPGSKYTSAVHISRTAQRGDKQYLRANPDDVRTLVRLRATNDDG